MTRADLVDIVGYIDPAGGRTTVRKTSSRSADVIIGQDDIGRVFVLHAWAGRIPTTAHTDRIFKLVEDFHPRLLGIDASAQQSLYSDSLTREAKMRAARLPLLPMKMPTTMNKTERVRSVLQPVIVYGRLLVQPTQRDLLIELEAFPGGATVDLVDALASAISILRKVSSANARRSERDAHVEFLKASGAPQTYIDEVSHR